MFKIGDRVERVVAPKWDGPQVGDIGTVIKVLYGEVRITFDNFHKDNPERSWNCFEYTIKLADEFEGN